MNVSHSKENILKNIRKALTESTPIPFPQSEGNSSVYQPPAEELELKFAEEFTKLQGKFIFCLDEAELVAGMINLFQGKKWTKVFCSEKSLEKVMHVSGYPLNAAQSLKDCDVSVTTCESLVARTGTIVLSAAQANGRTASVYAPVHVCIAYTDQLVFDIKDALNLIKQKYQQNIPSLVTFASGPSRTADIEKTLVVGVHGPKEVYVFLVDRAG
jgi:L-lactate dehydrogenase complex protein LldG